MYEAHERKVETATNYLDELDAVCTVLSIADDIIILPVKEIKKAIGGAEYSRIDYKGKFVKLWLVQKFGQKDQWILSMAPLKVL